MAKFLSLFITTNAMIIACFLSSTSISQQPYIREYNQDCENNHREDSGLGYFCNGLNKACQAFLTFRSTPPYNTVSSISTLLSSDPSQLSLANTVPKSSTFEPNHTVFVPVHCSCKSNEYYQFNASYVVTRDDTYDFIANNIFQGLTTCQALANQTGNPPPLELEDGQVITVPLRCACPTKNQSEIGVNYLMSYLTDEDDDDTKISIEFGVDNGLVLSANRLTEIDNTVYPATTFLVPLRNPPPDFQTLSPPAEVISPPPPPPPLPLPPRDSPSESSKKTWLFVIVGSVGGSAFLVGFGLIMFLVFFRKAKKKDEPIVAVTKSKELKKPNVLLENMISDIAQTIRVYSFEELRAATSGFSPSCLIRGSVYRGAINGDFLAIKKVDGDVSQEINLLQKINHFNVIALCGVCFNEGYWFLVYEYASNGSLSDWLYDHEDDTKFLSWTQRVQIALDVATGLNYLHSFANPSHVHKDLKSSNVLLDSDYRAKIANFGMARSMQAREGEFSLTSHIVGSVGYLAPEYLANGLVSTKLDVYSFGVVLLEMLTGKEASVLYEENRHLGLTLTSVISGVISDQGQEGLRELVDPSLGEKYPSEIVVLVVRIIDSCLKKNPETRPTMDEIVQVLSRALSDSLTWESSNNTVD